MQIFKNFLILVFSILTFPSLIGQGKITGTVEIDKGEVAYATVTLENTHFGVTTNAKGNYRLQDVPFGTYKVLASYVGYQTVSLEVTLDESNPTAVLDFGLQAQSMDLDAIVVTGTKTFKRQTNSPIIVNVVNSQTLQNVQACNLSDGLKFQPGLRVETDCQTCNYTQLRMNGLAGGYSQILINGRPIFSPLTGLYGMEQLPTNMIDRIEVVRGGGSSLYGSSAIGGTVNVITKVPKTDSYEVGYNFQKINGQTDDQQLTGNATVVSENKNSGISFFINRRERGFYDHNDDRFSEIPLIKNTSFGTNYFLLPSENQKLELSLSYLNEYRLGGEMDLEKPAYLTQQSEERTHHVWMGSADYQVNFNDGSSSIIAYAAWQQTDRQHYTGILPDEEAELEAHFEAPPYGTSNVATYNIGLQFNHQLSRFLGGNNVLTFGSEYVHDEVLDKIPAYRYLIDQTTKDVGLFVQSDWEVSRSVSLLTGVRMDRHNLIGKNLFSPRASLLYKLNDDMQFRLNYGTGFRAPQAFDTDLHIAFAGGGISRVSLYPDLKPEQSRSFSGSVNYDKPTEHFVAGFTIEAFYTRLNHAFFLQPIGADDFGELFEKQNGQGATVRGVTLETRANYDRKAQLEAGLTIQTSRFDEPVEYIDEVDGIRDFVRTPNSYGFATLSLMPSKKLNANLNYIYTGKMQVPHFAGAQNQPVDEIITTNRFSEMSAKLGYTIALENAHSNLEIYAGVRNVFNAYQSNFDLGKNRDSNFIYGPSQPRTWYVGVKLRSKK